MVAEKEVKDCKDDMESIKNKVIPYSFEVKKGNYIVFIKISDTDHGWLAPFNFRKFAIDIEKVCKER